MAGPMLITDSELTGVLKNVYSGVREKIFPISTPLMAQVKKGTAGGPRNLRWGGNGVFFDAVLTRPVGLTASDAGYFPPHAQATERQGSFPIKRLYATREIDGLAVNGTQAKEAAFVSLAKKIVEEMKDCIELGMQEILHGDGAGTKAEITVVTSTTVVDVQKPYGVTGAGQGGLLLDVGQYVAVLDASAAFAVLGRITILTIVNVGDTATVTFDVAVAGMAAGDILVAATTSDHSRNAMPNGLINITNRGGSYASLHGITQASFARWDAVRMVAGTDTPDADQPSESDIWDLIVKVKGRSGKDAKAKPGEFLGLTSPGVEKKLAESFYGQRRLAPSDFMDIKGGFKAISICGLPVISDVWNPRGTFYLVHTPSLTWIDAKDWGQVQYESAPAWRFMSGRDAFQLSFGAYLNFGTTNRAAHGSITSYTDTVSYGFVV